IDRHYGPRVDAGYVAREPGNIVIDFTVRAADIQPAASAINAGERVLWPAAIVDQVGIKDA
ncbi:hypothetical protein, partial [Escherichia coli]|uniref:hypothetical protein n=1 Tax=Escherichia coli TaxID=562 RepID=UPI00207C2EA7